MNPNDLDDPLFLKHQYEVDIWGLMTEMSQV